MAEALDDEDDAPMPDAPPEPELVDMPQAPCVCTPDVELGALHRIALGVRRWTALMSPKTNCHQHHITSSLCCLTCPLSRVCLFCVSCQAPKKVSFVYFLDGPSALNVREM